VASISASQDHWGFSPGIYPWFRFQDWPFPDVLGFDPRVWPVHGFNFGLITLGWFRTKAMDRLMDLQAFCDGKLAKTMKGKGNFEVPPKVRTKRYST
jgi:hypothetical protein